MFPNQGVVLVKKRGVAEWLALFIFLMPFFLPTLLQLFHMPSVIKYTIDLAWAGLLFAFIFNKQLTLNRKLIPMVVFICVIVVYTFVVYLFRFQSPFYYLWGVRNNFRFYIATFAAAVLLGRDDIKTLFQFIDVMFWANTLVTAFQFIALGHKGDYLGGIFGTEVGCNASTMILSALVVTKSLLMYMDGKEKTLPCWLKCGATLLLAALTELKFFFLVFVIILIMAACLTKFSWKKVVLFFVLSVFLMFSSSLLTAVMGSDISWETIEKLLRATSYSSNKDLGRISAIPTISQTILTDFPSKLFGLGLGNCDTASFSLCNTPFFQEHGYLHYSWFSSAFLFLETGYVGLMLNLLFFVIAMIVSGKVLKGNTGENRLYGQIGMIIATVCIILTFYNSSLRTEIGYIAYLGLALPWIASKQNAV